MPIRPEPRTYYCPSCGWQKTTAPRSDALIPGDFYSECPRCGNKDLKVRKAGLMFPGFGWPFPKGLPDDAPEITADLIKEKISQIRNYTPKVGVFGNSGVGKSTLCNALFGKEVAKISDVEACTRKPQEILINKNDGKGGITLIDVPGIGEDPERHQEYTKLYISLASELDLILWLIQADDRNYASGLEAYKKVITTNPKIPIIFVISQVDKINPSREWDFQKHEPGPTQKNNIFVKEDDVSKRFGVLKENIISISAEEKYNLIKFVDLVVEVLPNEKKYSFTREAKEENVSEEARVKSEKGIWDSIKEWAGERWDEIKEPVAEILVETVKKGGKWLLGKLKEWLG